MLTYFTLGTCHCLSKTWQRKKRKACVAHLAWCRNIRLRPVSKCPTLSCCQPWLVTNTQVCLQTCMYFSTIKDFFIKRIFFYKTHNQDLRDCTDPSAAHRMMVSLFIVRNREVKCWRTKFLKSIIYFYWHWDIFPHWKTKYTSNRSSTCRTKIGAIQRRLEQNLYKLLINFTIVMIILIILTFLGFIFKGFGWINRLSIWPDFMKSSVSW